MNSSLSINDASAVGAPRSSPLYRSSTDVAMVRSASTTASMTSRRLSTGSRFAIRSPSIGLPEAERKASPRQNNDDGDELEEEDDEDDAEYHNAGSTTGSGESMQRSAVESAADALLQRLRSRVRIAKPPSPRDADTDAGNNQQSVDHPPSPLPELQTPPRVMPVQSTQQDATVPQPLETEGRPLLQSDLPAERFQPSYSQQTQWRDALMAQASRRRNPGEQLDLPDYGDDMSSDFNSSGRIEELGDEEGAMSDGELMQSHGTLGPYSVGDAFEHSDDEHIDEEFDDHGRLGEFDQDEDIRTRSLSNRDVNVSKAVALKNAMLRNLIRLGFDQDLTRAAVDAGVREIEQYDSDCELAYVDIFMTLVKLVYDAHHDAATPATILSARQAREQVSDSLLSDESPRAQFKWPVFEMAQFEFGNARSGTCFDCVCVLINLPEVSVDRTEELMEVLSSCLFSIIGDPIQVLIPSDTASGVTRGCAFLEFDDPSMARACAAGIDGLTWGRGPNGRIRAKMFRQYREKSPLPPPLITPSLIDEDGFRLRRPPQPYRSFHRALPPRNDDSFSEQLRQSRELSREDLNISGMSSSNASWNTGSHASLNLDDSDRRRAILSASLRMQHSLSSLEDMAFRRAGDDGAMQLGELRLSSDEEDDGESEATDDDLELAEAILDRARPDGSVARARRMQTFRQTLPPLPLDAQMPMPRFLSNRNGDSASMTASSSSPARRPPSGVDIEGPWKAYCEELIARNREMQEQVSYARRRIAALGHNNQKLHLLIDRMERDRDGLMFENDLLQTQLHGYEDHERQQEALMKELAALRRRMKRRDQRIERGLLESGLGVGGRGGVAVDLEGGVMSIDELEEQLMQNIVSSRRLDDLKEWEQMLESSLARVRSIKEEIAMELQQKLAQQADDHLTQDHKLCVVCLSNEKSILCLPCRHLCLCQECSQHEELDKCPICRLVVENMLLVYA